MDKSGAAARHSRGKHLQNDRCVRYCPRPRGNNGQDAIFLLPPERRRVTIAMRRPCKLSPTHDRNATADRQRLRASRTTGSQALYLVQQPSGAAVMGAALSRRRPAAETDHWSISGGRPQGGAQAGAGSRWRHRRRERSSIGEGGSQGRRQRRSAPKISAGRVAAVANSFLDRYVRRNVGASLGARRLNVCSRVEVIPEIGDKRIGDVGRADIHRLLDGMVDRGSADQRQQAACGAAAHVQLVRRARPRRAQPLRQAEGADA